MISCYIGQRITLHYNTLHFNTVLLCGGGEGSRTKGERRYNDDDNEKRNIKINHVPNVRVG
jgi:hypothetical protein